MGSKDFSRHLSIRWGRSQHSEDQAGMDTSPLDSPTSLSSEAGPEEGGTSYA